MYHEAKFWLEFFQKTIDIDFSLNKKGLNKIFT